MSRSPGADGRPLLLFNSLGRRLEEFTPAHPPRVGVYTCGPTVYAYPHLGNLRAYVFADGLRRALEWKGYEVRQIVNITDVGHLTSDQDEGEDKMLVAALREGRSMQEIAQTYTQAFMDDVRRLAILPATVYPRASDHVPEMIEFVKVLEAKGYTYGLPSGLYFDTGRSQDYGRLALLDREGVREGRIESVEGKRNAADFALWRSRLGEARRAMEWESPWGPGAPGWHLECSVMSMKYLGNHFDIHTGGVDHREVHHVNEIAQSEAYLGDGEAWVRYWLHNEFLLFTREKMSKSAGGTIRLEDLIERGYHPSVFRHFTLTAHYRSKMNFSFEALDAAEAALRRLLLRVRDRRREGDGSGQRPDFHSTLERLKSEAARRYLLSVDEAVSADLNTPRALALVDAFTQDTSLDRQEVQALLEAADTILGLGLLDTRVEDLSAKSAIEDSAVAEIERLVQARSRARAAARWEEADALRRQLKELGVQVTDTAGGTEWYPIRRQPPAG